MPIKKYTSIDEYIIQFPLKVQKILKKVRITILRSVPDLTEGISYGIPTFYLNNKYLLYFAGFKNHISLYPATTEAVLKVKGLSKYKVSKGTLKFPLKNEIPFDLIAEFAKERYLESISPKKKN